MKIKIIFTATLLFCFSFFAFSQTKQTIAILPFTGGSMEDGETIAELFSFDQTLNSVFSPIPRTSINNAIRREQSFQMSSGMTDPNTISRIGHQLGARYIIAGTITNLGSQRLLVIAIIRIDNLQQIAGDWRSYTDIGEIQDKLPEMARNIINASRKDTSRLPRLAILPFQTPRGDREADALSQILAVEIVRSGTYAVYPRTKTLEQVQDEYQNQLNGDTSDDQMIAIGKGDNPLLALSGAVRSLGANRKMFNAAIINVESGLQMKGDSVNFGAIEEGIISMRVLGGKLTGVDLTVYNYSVTTAEEFIETINRINLQGEGNYTIIVNNNINIDREITFSSNAKKTINLKGDNREHFINRNSGVNVLFIVSKGITLVLGNNLKIGNNSFNDDKRLIEITEDGNLRMEAGATISGSGGGGVYVHRNATFIMNGGTIRANSDEYRKQKTDGGGVLVSGIFTMNGGTITENKCSSGGGVGIFGGTFTMNGGTISENDARIWGGGVYIWEGIFIMRGGIINKNAGSSGGGVAGYYKTDVLFIKTGGTISGNFGEKRGLQVKIGLLGEGGMPRLRNSASGPSVNLDSRVSDRAGGWEKDKY